jgi:Curli production assembly/transport component CsgG
MSRRTANHLASLLILFSLFFLPACATFHLNTIPPPLPTAKLRVYVQPHSTQFVGSGKKWTVSDEQFMRNQFRHVRKYLAETGIFEIVNRTDEQAVLGDQKPTYYDMARNDFALARNIGKALHADYVMFMERGGMSVTRTVYFRSIIVNVESGNKFGVEYDFPRSSRGNIGKTREIVQASYRDLFKSAKEDLLATAMKKSERFMPPPKTEGSTQAVQTTPAPTAPELQPQSSQEPLPLAVSEQRPEGKQQSLDAPVETLPQQTVPEPAQTATAPAHDTEEETPVEHSWIKKYQLEEVLTRDADPTKGKGARLVVYDFDTSEQYKTVTLILSEALREELFLLKRFILVDREDLEKVLQEMALQQTGLIDEKQAVKTGKVLAANQVITGRLGLLGKTHIFQAKRVDVETLATLGLASTKFKEGQEEEVLSKMPDLARSLAGM